MVELHGLMWRAEGRERSMCKYVCKMVHSSIARFGLCLTGLNVQLALECEFTGGWTQTSHFFTYHVDNLFIIALRAPTRHRDLHT